MATVKLPMPRQHQLKALLDSHRFKLAMCGRRWGKTTVGLQCALDGHGPGRMFRGALWGSHVWWVAPTYLIASEVWREIKKVTREVVESKNEVERQLCFLGGGRLGVRSADRPESLVGVGLDGLVVDEIGTIKQAAWTESLRPTLADKGGWFLGIGTPKGHNWVEKLFSDSQAGLKGWRAWQCDGRENKHISPEEFEAMRREMGPHKFAQEIGAQFTSVEGAEFSAEWLTDDVFTDHWPVSADLVAMAVDPSTGTQIGDYSALVCVAVQNGVVYADAVIERLSAAVLARKAVAQARRWTPRRWGVEANGFQQLLVGLMAEEMASVDASIPQPEPIKNSVNKVTRIQRLGGYLERGTLRIRRSEGGVTLLNQLREFPVGSHDDGPDALEMAVRLAEEMKAGASEGAADMLVA